MHKEGIREKEGRGWSNWAKQTDADSWGHTHTPHTNTQTRQLGGILNWRPFVLSPWPEATLRRIEPAFISETPFRVVWLRISPCCSFEVFIYHKNVFAAAMKSLFKGTGTRSGAWPHRRIHFRLLYILLRCSSSPNEDRLSVKLRLCLDVVMLLSVGFYE